METRKDGNGWETFLQHWGFSVFPFVVAVLSGAFFFFMNLRGTLWVVFFSLSFALMISGGALIGYAKLPAYRSGGFFTFGSKSVPVHLSGYYRWGWRVFLLGLVVAFGLLLSRS